MQYHIEITGVGVVDITDPESFTYRPGATAQDGPPEGPSHAWLSASGQPGGAVVILAVDGVVVGSTGTVRRARFSTLAAELARSAVAWDTYVLVAADPFVVEKQS